MRTCNCVGYLTNPGGRCCMDLQNTAQRWVTKTTTTTIALPGPVDEDRVRKIVREEIADLPIPFDVPDTPPEQAS